MTKVKYGSKYVQGADIKDIAAEVRKDIGRAVELGQLPKTKYSVRIDRYSGGQALIISAEHPEFAIKPWPHNKVRDAHKKTIRDITDAYNYDGSDIQADYHHVNFYVRDNLRSPSENR